MLTKVKLRQKPLADGKLSLYLDFYPPIADPVTGKKDTPGIPAAPHLGEAQRLPAETAQRRHPLRRRTNQVRERKRTPEKQHLL